MEVIADVAAKGFVVQANRVFSELLALLRWTESKGYVDGVPSIKKKDLRAVGAAKELPRRRTLNDAELGEAWVKGGNLGEITGDYLQLLMLVGQRRDEVRLMRAEHIDFDQKLWTVPAALYKTGIDHAVPLSDAAMTIIRRRCGNRREGYVFAGRMEDKPFNGAASALRRLRKAMAGRALFTLHDLRRTCRTGLSRLGTDEQTAELVIGHIPQGMSAVYDLHDRLAERRIALDQWAEHVALVAKAAVDKRSSEDA
jgi:integrase